MSRVTKYYYAGGQRVAMRAGGVVYYLHGDHLGSTSLTTDESGAMVARQLYHPYGTIRYSEGTLATDFGFTGQRKDGYVDMIEMGARWYDPQLGRWASADTIVPDPANPQSLNRYSYVRNNALKYTDPSGHTECIVGDCTETSPQHDPYAFSTLYGITFAGSWTPESRSAVMSAVRTVDQRLRKGIMTIRANAFGYGEAPRGMVYNPQSSQLGALSSGELQDGAVFRAVYGQITFRQVPAGDVDGWAWTRVATMGEIWVDAVGDPQYQQLGGQNTAHELGHALAQLLGGRPYDDLNATMIVDALGNDVAGGSGGTYIRTNDGYVLTNGSTWPWQQNTDATANEDFADMFLNWSYNSFDNDPAGAGDARHQWMSANMPSWIELAVTGR